MKRLIVILCIISLAVVLFALLVIEEKVRIPIVATPEGFAPLETEQQYAAMSPEGMVYRVRVMENSPKQTLEFWTEALRTHLVDEGYNPIGGDTGFKAGEIDGSILEWTLPHRGETYKYFTAVMVQDEKIALAEATAIHDVYDLHQEAIRDSIETIDIAVVVPIDFKELGGPSGMPNVDVSYRAESGRVSSVDRGESGCFLAGTPVVAAGAFIPVESLWPGTELEVYEPETDSWTTSMVERFIELPYSGDIVTLKAGEEVMKVTAGHPFFVISGHDLAGRMVPAGFSVGEAAFTGNGRWVEAESLQPGDLLLGADGSEIEVKSTAIEYRQVQVYHVEMTGPHTYMVTERGIVVHNGGQQEGSHYKAPVESRKVTREKRIIAGAAISAALPSDARNERIRVYSGACTLLVDRVKNTKRSISLAAEEVDGYVEESSDNRIVIRIPADNFRQVFDSILEMGETLYKAIETYDVTDQFSDPSGRLAVAVRARDRLYTLLNRVEDPEERLQILKSIKNYTETIERLELSLKVLEERIAMSRITIGLHSRLDMTDAAERAIPFPWIEDLHPIYESTGALDGAVRIKLPDDIAVFEDDQVLHAEAADGTRIRAGTTENKPLGDSLFWQRALIYNLEQKYREAEAVGLDEIDVVLFTSKDKDPFYYLVGAIPLQEEQRIVVFEVYFPHDQALERHYDEIIAAINEVTLL